MTKRVVSVVLLLCAAVFTALAYLQLDFYDAGEPGPGFFPTLIGLALILLCAINVLRDFTTAEPGGMEIRPGATIGLGVLALGYVLLFDVLGALVASVLFGVAGAVVLGGKPRLRPLVAMVAVPVAIVLVMQVVMRQTLPEGFLDPLFS